MDMFGNAQTLTHSLRPSRESPLTQTWTSRHRDIETSRHAGIHIGKARHQPASETATHPPLIHHAQQNKHKINTHTHAYMQILLCCPATVFTPTFVPSVNGFLTPPSFLRPVIAARARSTSRLGDRHTRPMSIGPPLPVAVPPAIHRPFSHLPPRVRTLARPRSPALILAQSTVNQIPSTVRRAFDGDATDLQGSVRAGTSDLRVTRIDLRVHLCASFFPSCCSSSW